GGVCRAHSHVLFWKAMAPAKKSTRSMTAQHKAALAVGRSEGRAVRNYLEALDAHKPKRGRRRTAESISAPLEKIEADLDDVDAIKRVDLIQERLNLEAELDALENKKDISELEGAFIDAAAGYSARKGISYAAWREAGVSAATLSAAGITRGH